MGNTRPDDIHGHFLFENRSMIDFQKGNENPQQVVGQKVGQKLGQMSGLNRKNRLPARIRRFPGTATGRHIHVDHISYTPTERAPTDPKNYLLGKKIGYDKHAPVSCEIQNNVFHDISLRLYDFDCTNRKRMSIHSRK